MTPRPTHRRQRRARLAARLAGAALAAAALTAPEGPARAETQLPDRFADQLVVAGLHEPVGFAFLPDGRILVVERSGPVRLVAEGKLGAIDPLMVVDSVDFSGDRGLTGIAIDPRWPAFPHVYLYYDALDGFCRISRYTAGGDLDVSSSLYLTLEPASRHDVLADIPDLLDLHNGGTLRFGPDSLLYAALGEDGFGCAAQDTTSLRGVMVRLEVRGLPAGPGGPAAKELLVPPDNPLVGHPSPNARLVWATGLRNPFRFHFDALTGDILLGDVGFNVYEEVDLLSGPMANFGWPYYEAALGFVSACPGIAPAGDLTPPIHAYDRTGFTASIIGGPVHRAAGVPGGGFPAEYDGDYFFADFYAGFVRRLVNDAGTWSLAPPVEGQPSAEDWGRGFQEVTDFAVGPDGALWYCRMGYNFESGTGEIGRITWEAPVSGVGDTPAAGVHFSPPFPSPSRGITRFSYSLPSPSAVEITIFDPMGRVCRRLVRDPGQTPGRHVAAWDGRTESGDAAASGVYIARLTAGGHRITRRVALTR